MKKILTILIPTLFISLSFSQQFKLLPSPENIITISYDLQSTPPTYTNINGKLHRDFTQSHKVTHMQLGAPSLPYFSESVIVPKNGKICLNIEHDGYIDYANIEVAPSKGSLKRNINPSDIAYTFGSTYDTNAFFSR
jgi:gingipain R